MKTIQHRFVKTIPDEIENGILYISIEYCTSIHKCGCGCGNEVVTPISPDGWHLTFDGESISLSPSIGNWNLECRSHYWIIKNKVIKAIKWSEKEIHSKRSYTKIAKSNLAYSLFSSLISPFVTIDGKGKHVDARFKE